MIKVPLPAPGNPGIYYRFYGTEATVNIYVENFGEDGVNVDVYTGEACEATMRVFKDGRQPITANIPGSATVSVQVSRAREKGESDDRP